MKFVYSIIPNVQLTVCFIFIPYRIEAVKANKSNSQLKNKVKNTFRLKKSKRNSDATNKNKAQIVVQFIIYRNFEKK